MFTDHRLPKTKRSKRTEIHIVYRVWLHNFLMLSFISDRFEKREEEEAGGEVICESNSNKISEKEKSFRKQ